jgi:hypothetical protein
MINRLQGKLVTTSSKGQVGVEPCSDYIAAEDLRRRKNATNHSKTLSMTV